jgi:hypothetical protein
LTHEYLEIITSWVEDDLAPALVLLEVILICSDKMKASAAEFFNKHADFVATEVREDVQCRQRCSRCPFDLSGGGAFFSLSPLFFPGQAPPKRRGPEIGGRGKGRLCRGGGGGVF